MPLLDLDGNDFEIVRKVLASSGCDELSSRASDKADFALSRIEERVEGLEEQLEAARSVLREIADYECEPFDSDIIEAHVSAAYNDLAKIAREALNPATSEPEST